jgi:DNA-binding winged helix-turn-helix (wHTH) protein
MAEDRQFAFGLFVFDPRTGRLWRDGSEVKLAPRAAAVLHLLAERAQELVTKQDLLKRVWGGMAVGDDALTSCIQELRGVLGDDARHPHYIETRHRRGYRLMVPAALNEQSGAAAPVPVAPPEPSRLVGRAAELSELARAFDQARSSRRQIVFISGEPGIGKSALAEAFLEQLRTSQTVKMAHGQCLDHHGVGEPYLPLIEALTRLGGGPDGAAVKEILSAQAPTWLAQMPALWTRSERNALEARGRASRERMMRELTLAIEAIASSVPLLLKLEDIHWSDTSTLDWLAHMARRPEPARLMVIATLRPGDAAAAKVGLGGLVTELALHGQCREIALAPLGLHAIESYLEARLGGGEAKLREMAPLLLERTGGNPLFIASIVNQLVQQEDRTSSAIVAIPHDVRRFIDRQIDDLTESDRHLLTAASVIRREFASVAVAAAIEIDVDEVETACARLARQGAFVVNSGSIKWPEGTRSELYAFRHDLYRELLYDRLPATRRALYHDGSAGGLKPRGPAGWTQSLPNWPSTSSVAMSQRARSPTTTALRTRPCAAARMRRRSVICEGHSMPSCILPARPSAPESKSDCSSRWAPPSSQSADLERRRCSRFTPRPRRYARAWANVRTFSRRFGANGCFGGDEPKWTRRGGFAKGCWHWPRNPAMPGSSCKPTTPPGRRPLGAADWRKSVHTPMPVLPSTMREFIKPWRRATATMTPRAALAISVPFRWRWPAMTTAHA